MIILLWVVFVAGYESAGLVLQVKNDYIVMGLRQDRPILDWIGGKRETVDQGPYHTAIRELIEELGGIQLELNPFSKSSSIINPLTNQSIVLFHHHLSDVDFQRLCKHDLHKWPADATRDFSALTGFQERARKTFQDIGLVKWRDLPLGATNDTLAAALFPFSQVEFISLTTFEIRKYPIRKFAMIIAPLMFEMAWESTKMQIHEKLAKFVEL